MHSCRSYSVIVIAIANQRFISTQWIVFVLNDMLTICYKRPQYVSFRQFTFVIFSNKEVEKASVNIT